MNNLKAMQGWIGKLKHSGKNNEEILEAINHDIALTIQQKVDIVELIAKTVVLNHAVHVVHNGMHTDAIVIIQTQNTLLESICIDRIAASHAIHRIFAEDQTQQDVADYIDAYKINVVLTTDDAQTATIAK